MPRFCTVSSNNSYIRDNEKGRIITRWSNVTYSESRWIRNKSTVIAEGTYKELSLTESCVCVPSVFAQQCTHQLEQLGDK